MTRVWKKCILITGQKSSQRSSGQAGSKSEAPWPWTLCVGCCWFTMDTKGEVCTCRSPCKLVICAPPAALWEDRSISCTDMDIKHINLKRKAYTQTGKMQNSLCKLHVLFIFGFRQRQACVRSKDKIIYFCVISTHWIVGCFGTSLWAAPNLLTFQGSQWNSGGWNDNYFIIRTGGRVRSTGWARERRQIGEERSGLHAPGLGKALNSAVLIKTACWLVVPHKGHITHVLWQESILKSLSLVRRTEILGVWQNVVWSDTVPFKILFSP